MAVAIAVELFLAWAIRDDLALDILRLLYPIAGIEAGQADT